MYTVPTKAKTTKLEQLLDISVGQHGYWLVNNDHIIGEDLSSMIKQHGLIGAASIINEIDNPLTEALYAKIKAAR